MLAPDPRAMFGKIHGVTLVVLPMQKIAPMRPEMKAAGAPGFPTRNRGGGMGELAILRQASASNIRIARQGEAEILPGQPDHQVQLTRPAVAQP